MFNIPIITYHNVSNDIEFGLTTISKIRFAEQMQFLKDEGYTTLCFKDILSQSPLPEKPIIVTFDDGYESIYSNAFPVMEKYGYKAVIFIITGHIGQINAWEAVAFQKKHKHLSKTQILELQRHHFEIGSHSINHPYLSALNDKEIKDELVGSKECLEDLTGQPVVSFSYPYGRFSKRTMRYVKRAEYQYATRNLTFFNNNTVDPLSLLSRSIYKTDSMKIFKAKIANNSRNSFAYWSEMIIQKGAIASIALNMMRNIKS